MTPEQYAEFLAWLEARHEECKKLFWGANNEADMEFYRGHMLQAEKSLEYLQEHVNDI